MKEFNLEVDYLITNDSSGPMKQMDFKYSAPGKIWLEHKIQLIFTDMIERSISTFDFV